MERSCYLKKRRADFVAGYLRGRVVVAGGLGEPRGPFVKEWELLSSQKREKSRSWLGKQTP